MCLFHLKMSAFTCVCGGVFYVGLFVFVRNVCLRMYRSTVILCLLEFEFMQGCFFMFVFVSIC